MTALLFDKSGIDLTPLKIFFSIMAIYFASLSSIAYVDPNSPSFEPTFETIITQDLKSCSIPHSTEYCTKKLDNKCEAENFWSEKRNSQQICPNLEKAKDETNES